jgi:hypothetical protein
MSTQAALPISRKARRLIKRFDDAAGSLAFVGSYAPEDRDEVERLYEDAASKLRNYIAELEAGKAP